MRFLPVALLSASLAACAPAERAAAPDDNSHPNVVLILADDLGQGDLGAYNADSKIETPHMDALAAAGMRFTDAHSNSAVCTPTRYGVLTGRYAWRTRLTSGVLWGYDPLLIDTTRLTLPAMLQAEGYRTAAVGKWHLGLGARDSTEYDEPLTPGPRAVGFDHFWGIPASLDMVPYVYVLNEGVEAPPTATVEASAHRRQDGGGFWRGGPAAPGFRHADVLPRTQAEAVAFIEGQASDEAPFFLYLPLSAPHTPWLPSDGASGRSGAGTYGDFVMDVDATVGAVMGALERTGQAANTLVILTSDNGAHWPEADIERYGHDANNGWRGQKADIHEGGHRVPFIVRWLGVVEPGSVSDAPVVLTDLMATVADVVGVTLPEGAAEDSYSFRPALQGEPVARDAMVLHSLDGTFAVRQGPWKLIEGLGSGGFTQPRSIEAAPGEPPGQLYNLDEDPGETTNVWTEHPDVVARLTGLLERIRTDGRSR